MAKECINEKAMANCKICRSLPRDTYNPFCANNSDPPLVRNGCQELAKPLSCTSYSVYKTAVDCEKNFWKNITEKGRADCGTALATLKTCLDDQLSQTCKDDSDNQRVMADIKKAVMAVLRGPRFFCEAVNLRPIDLDFKTRPMIPCKSKFFPEMEKCAKPVRMEFKEQNGTGGEFYSKFRTSLSCASDVQTSSCKFNGNVTGMIEGFYSTFRGTTTGPGGKDHGNAASPVLPSFALMLPAFVLQVPILISVSFCFL